MDISFLRVLFSVISLLLLMVPGFIIVKSKLVSPKISKDLSTIVLYVCTTALMFLGFQKCTFTKQIGLNILITAGLALLIHLLFFFIVILIFKPRKDTNRVIALCSTFSNCAYMGIPFLTSIFGNTEQFGEIMVYSSIIIVVFYILLWTIGVYIITGDKSQISFKKIALNPVIISIAFSLVIFLTVKVPFKELQISNENCKLLVDQIIGVIESIGNLVTPISMMIVGMKIAETNLKEIFYNKSAYIISGLKLVLMPAITLLVVLFPVDNTIKYVLFFTLSMPCATAGSMLTIQYNKDSKLASSSILLSNIISVISIPLLFLLFKFLCN